MLDTNMFTEWLTHQVSWAYGKGPSRTEGAYDLA